MIKNLLSHITTSFKERGFIKSVVYLICLELVLYHKIIKLLSPCGRGWVRGSKTNTVLIKEKPFLKDSIFKPLTQPLPQGERSSFVSFYNSFQKIKDFGLELKTKSFNRLSKKLLNLTISISLVFSQILLPLSTANAAISNLTPVAHIVVDGSQGGNTSVDRATNDTPIVNISTPNQNGLSHNRFLDYNVLSDHLILNNSKAREGVAADTSLLGGALYFNPNLNQSRTASTILNEVTSNRISRLEGYTEIYGTRADLIVANPNGIYIKGAGFLNTSRLSIITGRPEFNASGDQIDNFLIDPNGEIMVTSRNIDNGEGQIIALGLDAKNTDYSELISRVVKIQENSAEEANRVELLGGADFNIKTGDKEYNYATKQISSHNEAERASLPEDRKSIEVAIDSTAFGGMYAGRISLIATEAGVGVRNLSGMSANLDDIEISSSGDIIYKNAQAQGNIRVASSAGDVEALGNNLSITGNIALNAANDVRVKTESRLIAANDVAITGENLINEGYIEGKGRTEIILENSLINAGGEIRINNTLDIESENFVNEGSVTNMVAGAEAEEAEGAEETEENTEEENGDNSATVNSLIRVGSLDADGVLTGGTITNQTDSLIRIKGATNFTVANLENRNSEVSRGTIDLANISLTNLINFINEGDFISANDLVFSDLSNFTNSGNISSVSGNLEFNNITHLLNSASGIIRADLGDIDFSGANVANSGKILSGEHISFLVSNLNNDSGSISSGGNISFTGFSSFVNRRGLIASGGSLTINGIGDLHNEGGELSSLGNLAITLTGDIFNDRSFLDAAGNLVTITAEENSIISGSSVILTSSNLDNKGGEIYGDSLVFNQTGNIDNRQAGLLHSAGDLTATAASSINNDGGFIRSGNISVAEDGAVSIISSGDINLANVSNIGGDILSYGDLFITNTGSFNNADGFVRAKGAASLLRITATNLNNQNGLLESANDLELLLSSNFYLGRAGQTTAANLLAGNLLKIVANDLTIEGDYAGNNIHLETRDGFNIVNNQGVDLVARNDLSLISGNNLLNYGLFGTVGGDIELKGKGNFVNQSAGIVRSGNDLAIDFDGNGTNHNLLEASNDIRIGRDGAEIGNTEVFYNHKNIRASGDIAIDVVWSYYNYANSSLVAGEDLSIYFSNNLYNLDGAEIISGGAMILQARNRLDGSWNNNVTNKRSLIEAGGDLTIETKVLNNNGVNYNLNGGPGYTVQRYSVNGGGYYGGYGQYVVRHEDRATSAFRTHQAKILSGGNTNITVDDFYNRGSLLKSRGDIIIDIPGVSFSETSTKLVTGLAKHYGKWWTKRRKRGGRRWKYQDYWTYNTTQEIESLDQAAILTGVRNLRLSGSDSIGNIVSFALSQLSNNNTIRIPDGNGGYTTLTADQARAILADSSLGSLDSELNIKIAQQGNTDIDTYIEGTHFGERFRAEYLADNAEKTTQDGIDEERFNLHRDEQRHRDMQKSIDMAAVEDSQAQNNTKQAALLLAYFEQQYLQIAALRAEQNQGSSIEAGGDLIIRANIVDFANTNLSANGGGISIFGANGVNIGASNLADYAYRQAVLGATTNAINSLGIDSSPKSDAANLRQSTASLNSSSDIRISSNAGNIDITTDQLNSGGSIIFTATSGSITNESRIISARDLLSLDASEDIINRGGILRSTDGTVYLTAGRDIKNIVDKLRTENTYNGDIAETIKSRGLIEGNTVVAVAGRDILNKGSDITATEQAYLEAGRNVNIETETEENRTRRGGANNYTLNHTITNTASNITSGGNLQILANNELNIKGSNLNSTGGDINLQSTEGDVNITSVEDYDHYEKKTHRRRKFGGSKTTKVEKTKITQQASNLTASGGNINIDSGGDLSIIASNLDAKRVNEQGGDINLDAADDITVSSAINYNREYSYRRKSGAFSSKERTTESIRSTNVGATVEASAALLARSGADVNIIASKIETGGDLKLNAGGDLNVKGALDSLKTSLHEKKKSFAGVGGPSLSGGRLEVGSVTSQEQEKHETEETKTYIGSSLRSGGNTTLTAQDDLLIEGSNIQTAGNTALAATSGGITIKSGQNTREKKTEFKDKTIKQSVGVGNSFVDTGMAVNELAKATKAVKKAKKEISRMKNLYDQGLASAGAVEDSKINLVAASANLANATIAVAAAAGNAVKNAGTGGFYGDMRVDATTTKKTTSESEVTNIASNITSGGGIDINSNKSVDIIGSNVVAGLNDNAANKDINITAIDKVSIIASADTFRSNSKSETKTASVSVGGSIGASIGFQEAENSSKSTTYNNSLISAEGGALTVTSGGDTKLSGANLEAQDTALTVGGDLTVESLQNKSHSRSKSKGANIGFSSGGASVGFNFAKGNSDRTWVDDITSITGSNSVTINTAGNTHIKGAKIANENAAGEDLGNLTLATNSLTFENIKNSDETRNRGGGFSLSGIGGGEDQAADASKDNATADSNKAPKGSTTISLINESRWKEGNTKATIGNGNITIGGNTATTAQLEGLNRDINNTEEITRDIIDGALNASVTIDNRLLTKDGRASIKADFKDSKDLVVDIGKAIHKTATDKSVSLTGLGNGKTGILKNLQSNLIDRNVARRVASTNEGRQAVAILEDSSASPEAKQAARNYVAGIYRAEGASKEKIEAVSYADSSDVSAGFHTRVSDSLSGSTVFINEAKDKNQTVIGTTEVLGHELSHAVDAQRNIDYDGKNGLREEYAETRGEHLSDSLSTALSRVGVSTREVQAGDGGRYERDNSDSILLRANSDFASLIPQSERENSAVVLVPLIGTAAKLAGKHLIKKEVKKKVGQKIVEQAAKSAATSALNQEESPTPEVEGAEGEEVEANAKDKAEENRQVVSTGGGGDKEPDEDEAKEKLSNNWYESTFDSVNDSIDYHHNKHGKGRSIKEYTQEALNFFKENKTNAERVTLKNGQEGYKIVKKVKGINGKVKKIKGFYDLKGRIVSFIPND